MINMPKGAAAEKFLGYFEEFSRIPHGSGNTKAIADYFCEFARARGLEYHRDKSDNVIIRKPATPGYEDRPAVIFQGHLDMVEAKAQDCEKDMKTEGLELYVDGDFLRARGTTLGGDDGVALAYAMMVLDNKDIKHPNFEAVFTSDEEIGLVGAVALDGSRIKGRLLINIDSDIEGIFTVGCAGGMRSDIALPVKRSAPKGKAYRIQASGFKGGHSGIEINNGRANAIKVLGELLRSIDKPRVTDISGGNADNAIPRSAEAVIYAELDPTDAVMACADRIRARYGSTEPDITVTVSPEKPDAIALDEESSERLISLINRLPSGVVKMSEDIEGLVQTSLNMGIVRLDDGAAAISFSVRSAVGREKRELGDELIKIARAHGAECSERGGYPAWEYKKDSHLRDVMKSVYEDMYGKEPEIVTIHAGLECGIFSEKIEGLDCVSIGPDNFDIHTTEERLSLSSTVRVWEFLVKVLEEI